jgi:hypothetical protein
MVEADEEGDLLIDREGGNTTGSVVYYNIIKKLR